jgi:hypothetical protein
MDDLPEPVRVFEARMRAINLDRAENNADAPDKNRTCARGLGNRCSIH